MQIRDEEQEDRRSLFKAAAQSDVRAQEEVERDDHVWTTSSIMSSSGH